MKKIIRWGKGRYAVLKPDEREPEKVYNILELREYLKNSSPEENFLLGEELTDSDIVLIKDVVF